MRRTSVDTTRALSRESARPSYLSLIIIIIIIIHRVGDDNLFGSLARVVYTNMQYRSIYGQAL